MVGAVDLRKLEDLANQYGIHRRLESDVWPSALHSIVQDVENLMQINFQAYRSIDDQPWKEQNESRAKWLVAQAGRLSQNTANEMTWRTRIEEAILERFTLEVAWYVKRPRLHQIRHN